MIDNDSEFLYTQGIIAESRAAALEEEVTTLKEHIRTLEEELKTLKATPSLPILKCKRCDCD